MSEKSNITRTLEELRKATGIPVTLDEIPEGREEETCEKLAMLTHAYLGRYDRGNFLRELLQGTLPESEIYSSAARFHIPESGRRVLYVIELLSGDAEVAGKIVRQMFVSKSTDLFAVLDGRKMALIRNVDRRDSEEARNRTAHTIVDMLNTEAMFSADIGYGTPVESLKELPAAFRDASAALTIGRIFYTSENVFHYGELGLGRLIYDLPEKSCRLYLKELFGDGSPEDFDEETTALINALFDNNLNISEAARQLYVHRNTLVYRLEKLHQQTGIDLRNFDDAVEIKIAMMISQKLKAH